MTQPTTSCVGNLGCPVRLHPHSQTRKKASSSGPLSQLRRDNEPDFSTEDNKILTFEDASFLPTHTPTHTHTRHATKDTKVTTTDSADDRDDPGDDEDLELDAIGSYQSAGFESYTDPDHRDALEDRTQLAP